VLWVGVLIVVSHDGPKAMRRSHLSQEASTWLGCERGFPDISERGRGNKVAGEHNQVGTKTVDDGNSGVQRMDREVWVVMKIAEQSDRKTIQLFRPA